MILVDTNIWSELIKPAPDENVLRWEQRNASQLWLSTVVIGEFLSGVAMMPAGKRKSALADVYDAILDTHGNRIAEFDLAAARLYADVLAFLEKAGRNPGTADAQIAATARARGMSLATRNTKHFEGLGLDLIDPWSG